MAGLCILGAAAADVPAGAGAGAEAGAGAGAGAFICPDANTFTCAATNAGAGELGAAAPPAGASTGLEGPSALPADPRATLGKPAKGSALGGS